MSGLEDGFLIRQVLGGNPNAFRFLVLRYQRPVFKFLSQYRLGEAITEELAQETFLRAYRSLATYDPLKGAKFSSWLFQIASNLALNEKARARSKFEIADPDGEAAAALTDPAPDASQKLEVHEIRQGISAALERIPEDLRRALALSCIEELSLEEIAGLEARPVGTIKSRIHRGKQLLRALLLQSKGACKNGV